MSQVRTIFKNMSWLLISQIIASICGFIWTILIARYLGVSDYGILGFAISLSGMMAIIMDLGVNTHVVRHIATDYDSAPKYIGNAFPLKSIFSCGTFILTLIILILMKSNELTITITLLFTIEMIIKTFMGLLHGAFQAFEEGKYQGICNTLFNVILLIFLIISIYTDLGIFGITFSYIIANLIGLIYSYFAFIKHITRPKFEFDKTFCKKITILSLPFAATAFLGSIYYSIDVVMLTNMVGNYATGLYNATYKLISLLVIFNSIYGAVIFPVMSKLFKNDKKLLIISYEKSIKYLLMVIIPIAIGTVLYSTDLIHFIYGHEYDGASSILSILIWTVCLLFMINSGNALLNASHHEMSVTKTYLIAAIFNIIFNLILIPKYSYNGAALTTVLSDLIIVLIQTHIISKISHKVNKKLYIEIIKIIAGSLIMGITLYLLHLNMWAGLLVGIIIYFTIMYLLKFFDNEDKYVIKEILSKNN